MQFEELRQTHEELYSENQDHIIRCCTFEASTCLKKVVFALNLYNERIYPQIQAILIPQWRKNFVFRSLSETRYTSAIEQETKYKPAFEQETKYKPAIEKETKYTPAI